MDDVTGIARVLLASLDRIRFPWIFDIPKRKPTAHEREIALRWTAGLRTVQDVQTSRKMRSAARQEKAVELLLSATGFSKVAPREITVAGGLNRGEFCRESLVADRKCDVPVGLRDGRFLLIECKVSNSSTNSVKRLNRETGGKARGWTEVFGQRAVTAVVLAGVYKLKNLEDAQNKDHVVIFWERELQPLRRFLEEAT